MSAATTINSEIGDDFAIPSADWEDKAGLGPLCMLKREWKAHCPTLKALGCEHFETVAKFKEMNMPGNEKTYHRVSKKLRARQA